MLCCTNGACSTDGCIDLTEREALVCMTICQSQEPVSFSLMKSNLGIHQEVLSRIIRRLLNHGAIEKVAGRYTCRQVSGKAPDLRHGGGE